MYTLEQINENLENNFPGKKATCTGEVYGEYNITFKGYGFAIVGKKNVWFRKERDFTEKEISTSVNITRTGNDGKIWAQLIAKDQVEKLLLSVGYKNEKKAGNEVAIIRKLAGATFAEIYKQCKDLIKQKKIMWCNIEKDHVNINHSTGNFRFALYNALPNKKEQQQFENIFLEILKPFMKQKAEPKKLSVKNIIAVNKKSAPVACYDIVKAAPVKIIIDGQMFVFMPKSNKFKNLSNTGHYISLAEVKELHAEKLLTVPKQYAAAFKYFAQ